MYTNQISRNRAWPEIIPMEFRFFALGNEAKLEQVGAIEANGPGRGGKPLGATRILRRIALQAEAREPRGALTRPDRRGDQVVTAVGRQRGGQRAARAVAAHGRAGEHSRAAR